MSSNTRNSRDVAFKQRGLGLPINGMLCSRCNTPQPSAGGGFIRGRWYGACCKPKVVKKDGTQTAK